MKTSQRTDSSASGRAALRAVRPAFPPSLSTQSAEHRETARAAAAVDRVLVARFNEGDESAFDEIVSRHRQRIHALAGRFLRNAADAEEVAQDTFVRAYRGLARFRGDSSLATWLHHITTNLARNRYSHLFRRRTHLTLSLDCPLSVEAGGTFADLLASDEAGPVKETAAAEFVALVATCMRRLEAGHREILTLRNQLHYSYEDIADALGTNAGTVKSRIARARGKLRERMAEACPEFTGEAATCDWFEPLRSNQSAGALVPA